MIQFEGIDTELNLDQITKKITFLVQNEGYILTNICCVFMTDDELLELNRKHLEHDYYTDIITFDLSDHEGDVEADLYISIDRTKDNASRLGVDPNLELERVILHGVLHLTGYNDKSEEEQKLIRQKEDEYLNLQP